MIKAKVVGKVAELSINGRTFYLNEKEVRRMRSQMNRCLQRFAEKRREVPRQRLPRKITKVGYRYQVDQGSRLHLSECMLVLYPDEPEAPPGIEGVRCSCLDWYPEADSG